MKSKFYTCLFVGVLLMSIPAFGQKTVIVVQPDAGIDIGALNNAITSAADPGNTIFELKRDGLYLLNGAISHTGYTLHIRAEAGSGHRPILQPAADELGASANHFNPGGDIILEGLHLQGRGELGAIQNRMIIVSGTGTRVVIDDCYIDYANQSITRLTALGLKVFITNSTVRNSLRPENPANGRVVDTRGNSTDTIVLKNNTIYNNGSALISGGGNSNFVEFDHNTVFQVSFTANFGLSTWLKSNVTNNLFYNFCYRANNTLHQPLISVDSMFTFGEFTDADRVFDVSNNNFYTQPEIGEIMDMYGNDTLYRFNPWDTEFQDTIRFRWVTRTDIFANQSILDTAVQTLPPIILHFIDNGQVTADNIFSEALRFDNAPPLNLAYWENFVKEDFQIRGDNPPNPFADEDPNVLGEVTTGAYTFNYNDNSRSATAATGGLPLGDPKWVPYSTVSVGDTKVSGASAVRAYPNPFNSLVSFEIESRENSTASIVIFDLTGKEVYSISGKLSQGLNQVTVDLGSISRSGIYLYQVRTESSAGMKAISSGKIVKR